MFCQNCTKSLNCCSRSTCKGKTTPVLENLGNFGGQTERLKNAQRRLYPSILDPTQPDKVTDRYKLLCQSAQEPLPGGGMTSAYEQKCSRTGQKSRIFGVLRPTIFGPKTKQPVEAHFRPQQSEQIPEGKKIENGDTGNNKDLSRQGSG